MIDIRLPQINDPTEKGQLVQIKSYLYQLAEQLQWALSNADTSNGTVVVASTPKSVPLASSPSAEAQFSAIKPLIIKSADIVEAFYEEINNRLKGIYIASSDYGTFKQATEQSITETSKDVTQAFTNIQEIETNLQDTKSGIGSNLESLSGEVGKLDTEFQEVKSGIDTNLKAISDDVGQIDSDLKNAKTAIGADIQGIKDDIITLNYYLVEANAHIKSGLLDYDENEIPIYGLEIGQRNVIDGVEVFNKYARFTAGRLSFYDKNGFEVAYISDFKLYITHAEVTGTLKLGGYLVSTSNGLTFKWVGR
jgi:hypothetical protein